MSAINFHTKEISVKIVYYGPGLCGKTTTLQTIYNTLPEEKRPQLVSLATDVDRTIFFDFLPLTAYRIRDFTVRLQLYTVPGQVFYNATRKLVLNGVDGIVFVSDSQRAMQDSNIESLQNLEDNLNDLGLEYEKIPMIMQFNKRDLSDICTVEEMDQVYNRRKVPVFATTATTGVGLKEALKTISQLVVNDLIRKGLGQQLRQHAEEQTPAKPSIPSNEKAAKTAEKHDAFSEGFSTVEAAVNQTVSGSFWPPGETHAIGERIVRAIEGGQWLEAVLNVEGLLKHELKQWAVEEGHPSDAFATFLYLRGVPPTRYRAFLRALVEARASRPISQASAMNALVMALEIVW